MIKVDVIKDSITSCGARLTTIVCTYPRFIHSELMTHRVFSRNASSSRAIPVWKMIKEAFFNPVEPMWVSNQPGMRADNVLGYFKGRLASLVWNTSRLFSILFAILLSKGLNVHKQIANRILEPYVHITVIITATEWDNFFKLRCTKHAQQEISKLARTIQVEINRSNPIILYKHDWHLPFIRYEEVDYSVELRKRLSVARCARVSYLNHDKSKPDASKDVALHDSLLKDRHMSPFEHVATPECGSPTSNLIGWKQYRKEIEE